MTDKIAIQLTHISKDFGGQNVLSDINFSVKKGEFICLLGPSGCGKSTLLRILAGLEHPSTGQVTLFGKEATHLPAAKRNFGIVFQSYALFPNMTAFENIAYGLRNKGVRGMALNDQVNSLLKMVHLEEAANRLPQKLSGGEQQRVALARALAVNPDYLLLDEPLSALDAKVRQKLRREICSIVRELGLTTIMVTHDQEEALTMADRVIVMDRAKVIQIGTPEEIYHGPKTRFVADFIGLSNVVSNPNPSPSPNPNGASPAKDAIIRPESIELVLAQGAEKGLPATVVDVAFCGGLYRVIAKSESGQEWIVDISNERQRALSVAVGMEVLLHMPQENIIALG